MPSVLLLSALLLLVTACRTTPGGPDPASTSATIENRASVDMDLYVRRNDGRVSRLGFVSGGEKTTFALPATLTAGAAWVRFEAKPVRGGGETVVSEPFPVRMGDQITWSVPPQ